jgi:hypothetical protein
MGRWWICVLTVIVCASVALLNASERVVIKEWEVPTPNSHPSKWHLAC